MNAGTHHVTPGGIVGKGIEPRCYIAGMSMAEPDWWTILRALDEPLAPREPPPPVESFLRPVDGSPGDFHLDEEAMLAALSERPDLLGNHVGWEVPRDFDCAATQARFDRLTERLSEAFGVPLVAGTGPQQDAAYSAAF